MFSWQYRFDSACGDLVITVNVCCRAFEPRPAFVSQMPRSAQRFEKRLPIEPWFWRFDLERPNCKSPWPNRTCWQCKNSGLSATCTTDRSLAIQYFWEHSSAVTIWPHFDAYLETSFDLARSTMLRYCRRRFAD